MITCVKTFTNIQHYYYTYYYYLNRTSTKVKEVEARRVSLVSCSTSVEATDSVHQYGVELNSLLSDG
jgi:hypothetical protein